MHPHFGFRGPPRCCTPVWGQQGHSGSPRVASWGLSGHLALVGHQCCPYWWQTQSALQLLREQRKRGTLCLLLSPGHLFTALPLCPPSLLPISVLVQQNCLHPMGSPPPAEAQGVLGHLFAPLGMQRGFGGLLAPPGMLGRRAFGVFWHPQACRGEASRLLAPPACWRGYWGLTFRHVGGVEGLMAPPDVLQWVIWGLVGSPFMFRGILWALSIFRFVWGRLGVSSHLQVC